MRLVNLDDQDKCVEIRCPWLYGDYCHRDLETTVETIPEDCPQSAAEVKFWRRLLSRLTNNRS